MKEEFNYPKLRHPLDLRLEKVQGQEVIILNCPLGISPQPLVLVAAIGPILASLEGKLSFEEILAKFSQYGLNKDLLLTLLGLLDENLFLAGSEFYAAQARVIQEFKELKLRPAALAGMAYPKDPIMLKNEIERYLSSYRLDESAAKEKMACLVVPHIDYRRGHATYGKSYNMLRGQEHDLYILIGTSHQLSKGIFHLSLKDFDSPLGKLECDIDFMQKLAAAFGEERAFSEEHLHRREHSLELQLPFMKSILKKGKIAPILVGSFFHLLLPGSSPEKSEEYTSFITALTETARAFIDSGRSLCVVAGVDMSHVGTHFGDKDTLTEPFMKSVETRDSIYLKSIESQDKALMLQHISEDSDARRICGFPTMYTVIDLFDRLGIRYKPKLFEYRQAVDYSTDCAVTFAGMGLYY